MCIRDRSGAPPAAVVGVGSAAGVDAVGDFVAGPGIVGVDAVEVTAGEEVAEGDAAELVAPAAP